jgi:adenylate cyclase
MRAEMAAIDFESEGLLEGLQGEAREDRLRLLTKLADDGVSADELRKAVEEDRLVLLPVERALAGGEERLTAAEVAERAGIDEDFLRRQLRALGLAAAGDDAAVYTERDVEAAERVRELRDAGVPEDGILEVARLLGMTMSQLAAANRRLVADTFLQEGDTEYEVATRFAEAARAFMPLIADLMPYALGLHLREQIRHDAFGQAELSSGRPAARDTVTVCFVDMVDFTQLGETLDPEALGALTGRFTELAAAAVEPPVRLVKLIGDAAMFVGPEPGAVVEAALELVETAGAEGKDFPLLRAGIASGEALPRGGDWYGRPVNLASRITAIARPDSLLAEAAVHDALADDYAWSFAGARRLKGIDGSVKLWRCRRADGSAE